MAPMDDVYAINVAKSNYREGFDTADVERVLSAFAPEFTDMSDGASQPLSSGCRREASPFSCRTLCGVRSQA